MMNSVQGFRELSPAMADLAGGKGAMLARMFQKGYPVPDGFIVLPMAFEVSGLNAESWEDIRNRVYVMRQNQPGAQFAIRSSAMSEDSENASFAGEFETLLNVRTDEEIREALMTVYRSRSAERVESYSSAKGYGKKHQIAVVVQLMVDPDFAGVLFTVDPLTGSHLTMKGNYVHGLGERLVSGEANPHSFTLAKPHGKYQGPQELRTYARKLYNYASKLHREQGMAQDIEWAAVQGKLYMLQARPITTLNPGNKHSYEWNDSFTGDFLWTNTNVGESIPDVLTPLNWSILRELDLEQQVIPGYYMFSGNICGRVYSNISMSVSAFQALGMPKRLLLSKMSHVFGTLPQGTGMPWFPFNKWELLRAMWPRIRYANRRTKEAIRQMPQHLESTIDWCIQIKASIHEVQTREQLLHLWNTELWPRNTSALWSAFEGSSPKMQKYMKVKQKLVSMLGEQEADLLLSNAGNTTKLESLGPLRGIYSVVKGQMTHEEYRKQYGHRGPHEHELSIPDPGEDVAWLNHQIQNWEDSPVNVEAMLLQQQVQYNKAWERFRQSYPIRAKRLSRKLVKLLEGPALREAARSEWTRVFRVNRFFVQKAGELSGMGEDIFYFYLKEILVWLGGGELPVGDISARKEMYNRYQNLPSFPNLIRGRFDPFMRAPTPDHHDNAVQLNGFPGASGQIEGIVRILTKPEEGDMLKQGEILVTSTTNVGWTPLFLKSAAIVTDIGAPLSHAAIVARELGIPAVVGCGNATSSLKTGDRILVDGAKGKVYLL
ncbi:PEP/pyruvate-binding domain-containing protein [Paenibacillus sp. NPDC057886]|uniref:PEP/pyruvate-binding domain-containing protein n=1 Tax=Paenibacillus sp. NPDC057886 TaxID=3346270 RepID=UPI0036B90CF2